MGKKIENMLIPACILSVALSGCGSIGDTKNIKAASELAINCQYDAALSALKRAEAGGGLSAYVAELEYIAFLREAGRVPEAEQAFANWAEKHKQTGQKQQDASASINQTVSKLREERLKKTGSAECAPTP